jgi:ribosomal protein L5
MQRLDLFYRRVVAPDLLLKLPLPCVGALPAPSHLVVSTCGSTPQAQVAVHSALTLITGQQPRVLRARRHLAAFQLRRGQWVGAQVVLRGAAFYHLLDLLTAVLLPRHRDFTHWRAQGGHLHLGLRTLVLFPQLQEQGDLVARAGGCTLTLVATRPHPLLWSALQIPASA